MNARINLPDGTALQGAQSAKELNLLAYMPLCKKFAGRYRKLLGFDTALQVAFVGLCKARDAWDETRGTFGTVAILYVSHELRHHADEVQKVAGIPKQSRTIGRLRVQKGARPEEWVTLVPGDTPLNEDGGTLFESIPDEEASSPEELVVAKDEARHAKATVETALASLTTREREVVEARYLTDPPQELSDLARRLNISASRVNQLEWAALTRMRKALRPDAPDPIRRRKPVTKLLGVMAFVREQRAAGISEAEMADALAQRHPTVDPKIVKDRIHEVLWKVMRDERQGIVRKSAALGVMAFMHEMLEAGLETKAMRLKLAERFPERDPVSLRQTLYTVTHKRRAARKSVAPNASVTPRADNTVIRSSDVGILNSSRHPAAKQEFSPMKKIKKSTPAKKAPATKAKAPGVIASIVEIISMPKGATIAEIVAVLAKKFPDREVEGMTATARIQANRNSTRKEKDEDGAVRYFAKAAK